MSGPDLVIDNSVTMSWAFANERSPYALAVLQALHQANALVPAIWPLEVVNVILVAERNKRIKRKDSDEFLTLLTGLPISVVPDTTGHCFGPMSQVARRYGLSAYDASYLSLALTRGLPLATQDNALKAAAKKAQVPLFKP